jgi:hypothetical protein
MRRKKISRAKAQRRKEEISEAGGLPLWLCAFAREKLIR